MKTCPRCGKLSQDNYGFCPACGSPLKSELNHSRLKSSMGNTKRSTNIPSKPNNIYTAPVTNRTTEIKTPGSYKGADLSSFISKIKNNKRPKYIIAAICALLLILVIFFIVSNSGNYYSVNEANEVLENKGYRLGDPIGWDSSDGYFRYTVFIEPEEYRFASISGYLEFIADYSESTDQWRTSITPYIDYEWHLSGQWYAETENYYVYLDILDFDGEQMHAILEAEYDSIEGGRGSYGEIEQTCYMDFVTDDYRIEDEIRDLYIYCSISGNYPVFTLRVDKDSMTIWQLYDSYHAEFTPN